MSSTSLLLLGTKVQKFKMCRYTGCVHVCACVHACMCFLMEVALVEKLLAYFCLGDINRHKMEQVFACAPLFLSILSNFHYRQYLNIHLGGAFT